jgi:hypothetical protein
VWQKQMFLSRSAEDEGSAAARRRASDLDAYTHLMTLRALETLGAIDPETGESTMADMEVTIEPAGSQCGLRVHFRHASGGEVTLLVGSVPYSLGDSLDPFEDPQRLHEALALLDTSARERHELCCLVHPSLRRRLSRAELSWMKSLSLDARDPYPSVWRDLEGLLVLPAHPLGVDCLEAFGRMYRMIIETLRSRAFPLTTPITGSLREIPDAAIDVAGSGLEVVNRHLMLTAPTIDRSVLVSDGRRTRRAADRRPQDLVDWETVLEPLDRMRRGLLTCPAFPVEHRDLAPIVEYWNDKGFRARCNSCSTVWGFRVCESCQQRHHFMLSESDTAWDEARLTVGPGDYFGMDLTAEPCTNERGTFICPSCHYCPSKRTNPDCLSCNR